MSRFVGAVLVSIALFASIAFAGPAQAESPTFDLTVTHDPSATDHVVLMTVTTNGTDQVGPQTLNVFLRSDLDDQLRPFSGRTGVEVDLVQTDAQTAKQVVVLPKEGEWVVLPFADLTGEVVPLQTADVYPIVSFAIPWTGATTRIRAPSKSSSPWPVVAAIGGGAVVAALAALGLFRMLDRRSVK